MNKLGRFIVKHLPSILSYVGCAGVVATGVLAAVETPSALQTYKEFHETDKEGETSVRTILMTGKNYIPAIAVGSASIACILVANGINVKRIGTLARSYNVLSRSITKERLSKASIAGSAALAQKISDNSDRSADETEHMFYIDSPYAKEKWFKSTWKDVMEAAAKINDRYAYNGDASLREYFDYLGIEYDWCLLPDELGWDVEWVLYEYECPFIPFEYTEDVGGDKTCCGIYFPIAPRIYED